MGVICIVTSSKVEKENQNMEERLKVDFLYLLDYHLLEVAKKFVLVTENRRGRSYVLEKHKSSTEKWLHKSSLWG